MAWYYPDTMFVFWPETMVRHHTAMSRILTTRPEISKVMKSPGIAEGTGRSVTRTLQSLVFGSGKWKVSGGVSTRGPPVDGPWPT